MTGMRPEITLAGPEDETLVREMMREFYLVEHLPFDAEIAAAGLRELWTHPALGRVHLAAIEGRPAGYLVLTFGFSLEFHGRDALVDELYVREANRGQGVGTALLVHAEEVCRGEGVRALHLEVDHANPRAKALYHRRGYRDHDRHLLTRWLDR